MEFYMNSNGNTTPTIKEYVTNETVFLKKGTLMMVRDGKVLKADGTMTPIGILAEDYDPEPNELNVHAGDKHVRVIVSPNAVYRVPPFRVTLTENGTTTTMKWPGTVPTSSSAFKGGYFRLLEKGENSTNTDPIGTVRESSGTTESNVNLEEGGVPCAGDVYEIFMPVGSTNLTPETSGTEFKLCLTTSSIYRVVGSDPKTGYMEVIFRNSFFAV